TLRPAGSRHRGGGDLGGRVPAGACGAHPAGRGGEASRSTDLLAGVTGESLIDLLAAELQEPAPDGAKALAAELARRGGHAVAAVLYYGSTLRTASLDGILDFYVLVDRVSAWPGSAWAHLANRVLPPNVGYPDLAHEGAVLRAKYAVMTPAQFQARVGERSRDTTIWARFCQPALCIWTRSTADRTAATELVAGAVTRAAWWAAHLGPVSGSAGE